jgi:hypothetical protein
VLGAASTRELAPLAAVRIGTLTIVAKRGWLLETVGLENGDHEH